MIKKWTKWIIVSSLIVASNSYAAQQTVVFAGGCFWGVDAVFKHLTGVVSSTAGYSGGSASDANYIQVSTGKTGHAEAVQVVFEDSKISYRQLLEVFLKVAHNPTEFQRQGPDVGPQYRSAIFYTNPTQQKEAKQYIAELTQHRYFNAPIVTELTPLTKFFPAEDYHQNYVALHPDQPYIVYHDKPKLLQLQRKYPQWYKP